MLNAASIKAFGCIADKTNKRHDSLRFLRHPAIEALHLTTRDGS